MKQAIFLIGGPGSGKDIILKEILTNYNIKEFQVEQTKRIVKKFFKEILVITGNAYSFDKIKESKDLLDSYGYSTSMIYVDVNDETSQIRVSNRYISEEKRIDRLIDSKLNIEKYQDMFEDFYYFDNSFDQFSDILKENLYSLEEDLRSGATLYDKRKIGIKARMYSLRRSDEKQHSDVEAENKARHLTKTKRNGFSFHNKKSDIVNKNVAELRDKLRHECETVMPTFFEAKNKKVANTEFNISTTMNPIRGSGVGPVFDLRSAGIYRLGGISSIYAESIDSPSTDIGFPGVEGSGSNRMPISKSSSYEYGIKKKKTNFEKSPEDVAISKARKIVYAESTKKNNKKSFIDKIRK